MFRNIADLHSEFGRKQCGHEMLLRSVKHSHCHGLMAIKQWLNARGKEAKERVSSSD